MMTGAGLLAHVWQRGEEVCTNIVDVYISHLRRKLGGGARGPVILTEHGAGYRLVVEEPEA